MSASRNRIYFVLQRTAHLLKTVADASLTEASGLTTAQSAVMTIIAQEGPITQRRIADMLFQRESAVTAMAARLLKAGYIVRERSREDARAWQLTATNDGLSALARVKIAFDKINAILDERSADKEMDKLANSLEEILGAFDNT